MRCGKCENCKKLERVKEKVLACCGTPSKSNTGGHPFPNHADDGVVAVWNKALIDYPCLEVIRVS